MSSVFYLKMFSQVAWEALLRVVSSVPKEVLPSYMKLVRDAVSTSRDKERRKKKVSYESLLSSDWIRWKTPGNTI